MSLGAPSVLATPANNQPRVVFGKQGQTITRTDYFFTVLSLAWKESVLTAPFDLYTVNFGFTARRIRFLITTFDNGGTFKTPAISDLILYGGIDQANERLFAFRYGDYRQANTRTQNALFSPLDLRVSANRIRFRVEPFYSYEDATSPRVDVVGQSSVAVEWEPSDNTAAQTGYAFYGIRVIGD